MTIKDIEIRLKTTETALNEALNEIERLKNERTVIVKDRSIKDFIDKNQYDYVFNYNCNKKTGEFCDANIEKKYRNFGILCRNITMACGYTYPRFNSKDNAYFLNNMPLKDIPDDDFNDLCELIKDIVELLFFYKKEKGKLK